MRIEEINKVVVNNILKIIDEKGLKKKAVAQKANISMNEFSSMINGRKIIKVNDIENFIRALDVDANELFKSLQDKQEESVQEGGRTEWK